MTEWTEQEYLGEEYEGLKLRSLNKTKNLKLFPDFSPSASDMNPLAELMQVSNEKEYIVAGLGKEFIVARTEKAREACKDTVEGELVRVSVEKEIERVLISPCHEKIIIICEGWLTYHFDAQSLLDKSGLEPVNKKEVEVPLPKSKLIQYLVNPDSKKYPFNMMLLEDGRLLMMENEFSPRWQKDSVVSASFSPQGGRVARATRDGSILICSLNGTEKLKIPLPPSLKGDHVAHHIHWVSDDEILAVYWETSQEANTPIMFLVHLESKFFRLGEVFLEFEARRSSTKFYCNVLSNLSPEMPTLVFLAASQSTELIVLVRAPTGKWMQVFLEEIFQVVFPFNPSATIVPRGIALDLTSTSNIRNLYPENPDMPPVPILYIVNTNGELQAYECISKDLAESKKLSMAMKLASTREIQIETTDIPVEKTSSKSPSIAQQPSLTFAEEMHQILKTELVQPLLEKELDDLPFPEILDLAKLPPTPSPSSTNEMPSQAPKPEPATYSANTADYAQHRRLFNHVNFSAATVGLYKDRWDKYVDDSGDIQALSNDIDALWDEANKAHTSALAVHNNSLLLLKRLKSTAKGLTLSEQLLARHFQAPIPSHDYAETDPTYQTIATGALLNLEAKLHTFQNMLNVINRQFFSDQSMWAKVLDQPHLNNFLTHLQELHEHTQELQGKLASIKGSNPKLDFIFNPTTSTTTTPTCEPQFTFAEAIAAASKIPIPATAIAQGYDKMAQQAWLEKFQEAYIKLYT